METTGNDSAKVEGELVAGGEDFDLDGALTREFLLRRGRCCREACRNCPYGFNESAESEK